MHPIYDTDNHFTIDPVTRALTNELHRKTSLIQGDHNSERFTFELPKEIEGHDMTKCNVVQVHFNNIDSLTKEQSKAFYNVTDLEESGDTLVFSWLISSEATKYVGLLSFVVRFSCVDAAGKVHYVWNTAVYSNITVANGICNTEVVLEEYTDILSGWIDDLEANQIVSIQQTQYGIGDGGENIWTATFGDGRTSSFVVKNGVGGTGKVGSLETVDGGILHFFVGTKAEYDALPENIKTAGLFAIITDETQTEDEQTSGEGYSPIYRATAWDYGVALEVQRDGFEDLLVDGVEILVCPTMFGRFNPDSGNPRMKVGNTDTYPIYNGVWVLEEYPHLWNMDDILRFRFDEANSRWLLVENVTTGELYPVAWKKFDPETFTFEIGKTYQVFFYWPEGSRLVQYQFSTLDHSFYLPTASSTSTSIIGLPVQGSGALTLRCHLQKEGNGYKLKGNAYDFNGQKTEYSSDFSDWGNRAYPCDFYYRSI